MLLKLHPWRRSPSSPFLLISRFLSHSPLTEQDDEIYDPPFSATAIEAAQKKSNSKLTRKKKQPPKSAETVSNSGDVNEFPVKSELPFDFMYSYSEVSPAVEPIGFREPPRFSPFGPGRLDRNWTGTCAPALQEPDSAEDRRGILGDPLSEEEITELVEKYRHNNCTRQINLGRGGVTHNSLEDIHNHWRRAEADKTGGKIIYRHINILILYRGRNYDPRNRPQIPVMLWKPRAPIYPKLVKNVADGLTHEETKEKRNRGLNSPPLIKLTRNGVYVNVVEKVRTAFETEEVVRLDCTHVGISDCKKIGVKLRDLVPCVPLLFKDEQIILWKGKIEHE